MRHIGLFGWYLCLTTGLSLSIYLTWLKVANAECPLGHCDIILNSRFGTLFGLPTAIYGMWCWLCIVGSRRLSPWAALILASGGLCLAFVQVSIIASICWLCMAHTLCAVLFWLLNNCFNVRPEERAWPLVIVIAILFPALAVLQPPSAAEGAPAINASPQLAKSIDYQSSYDWFGKPSDASPIIVISLSCPHCLKLLERWKTEGRLKEHSGPKIFLISNTNQELSTIFVASAVFHDGRVNADRLGRLIDDFPTLEDSMMVGDATELKALAEREFPDYKNNISYAEHSLQKQAEQISKLPIRAVPFFLTKEGQISHQLSDREIW